MNDSGDLFAADNSEYGVERIRENSARLKLTSIQAVRADTTKQLAGALSAPYDRILVDAPCSGLGTLRSHPEIKWQRRESDIQRLSELQMQILENAASYLKPGGVLVYSTCTLTREENETVVENFVTRHKQFELEDAAGYLPNTAKHMVRGRYFQALPQRDNTDGFFAARMRKGI
jgi:16S rRNA (cytosine967-C5)-methyltransferase